MHDGNTKFLSDRCLWQYIGWKHTYYEEKHTGRHSYGQWNSCVQLTI